MSKHTPAENLRKSIADWEKRQNDDGTMPRFNPYPDSVKQVLQQRDELLAVLQDVQLCAQVNAPINDGSPMHKAILKVISKATGGQP